MPQWPLLCNERKREKERERWSSDGPALPPSPFDVDDDFAVVRIDQPIMPSLPVAMAALEAGGRQGREREGSKQAEISFSETKALSLLPLTPCTHG